MVPAGRRTANSGYNDSKASEYCGDQGVCLNGHFSSLMPSERLKLHAPVRIEIIGGNASGKTTLAKLLARKTELTLVLEKFRGNPFWAKFYAEPAKYLQEKNIVFLPLHTGAIKARSDARAIVCDYAVFQDLVYAQLSKRRRHIQAMEAVYRDLYSSLSSTTLFIYLRCAPHVQLERIKDRHRREEVAITTNYLRAFNQALEKVLISRTRGLPLHIIDSDLVDFAHDLEQAARIKAEIFSKLGAANP